MGKGGFGKRNRSGRGGRSSNRYKPYAELVKENEQLCSYYDGLLGLDETEREAFWAAFRRELPHSFRFCGSKGHALAVQKLLQTRYIPNLAKMEQYEGQPVRPPQPVPWYPDQLAWWMTTSKTVIRKFPPYAAFQKFLVSETSVGNISRQEVVSMIPPLLLDVRPGMAVLDLCAAPGSKAAQLLEMLHAGEEARVRKVLRSLEGQGQAAVEDDGSEEDENARLEADPSDDGRATGVLIANDADYKRSHLLIHQLKRLSSPNIIVTNHDATIYPSLRLPQEASNGKPPAAQTPVRYLKFDRILADVPCSGDGTLRKNVVLWRDWNPGNALGLHQVQLRILVRALQMLKVGGRVVYSTCSLNPVENESVVAAAVALCGGPDNVALLDSSDKLPLLQRRPGFKKWHILDKSGRKWNSWAEVEAFAQSEEGGGIVPSRLVPSMFPSTDSDAVPLERCLRVYPHLQDTGGFFIVALEKRAEFKVKEQKKAQTTTADKPGTMNNGSKRSADNNLNLEAPAKKTKVAGDEEKEAKEAKEEKEEKTPTAEAVDTTAVSAENKEAEAPAEASDTPAATEAAEATATAKASDEKDEPAGPRRKGDAPYEEPFKYLAPDHPVVADVQRFYGLSTRFPSDRFMVRNAVGEPLKAIYYTSALVRDILTANTGDSLPGKQARVKVVHGGVRMFVKQDAPSADVCRWRIQAEGMPLLQGYVGQDRVVRLYRKSTLRALLVEMFPKFDGPAPTDSAERLGEVGERLPDLGMGCFVLKVEPGKDDAGHDDDPDSVPLEPMALPLWKSFHSLNLMLPKEDRAAMLLRIFNDTTPLVNNSVNKKLSEAKPATLKPEKPEVIADPDAMVEDTVDVFEAEDAPSP